MPIKTEAWQLPVFKATAIKPVVMTQILAIVAPALDSAKIDCCISVALTVAGGRSITQVTDAFGKSVFAAVPVARLGHTCIGVGPLAELAEGQL